MLGAKLGIQSTLSAPFKKKNLWGWYDANSGVKYDGSNNLTTWYDRSGNGNTIWNVNSAPVYTVDQANGYPVVQFDGTDDFCYTNSNITITTGKYTLFMVMESSNSNYDQMAGFEYSSNSGGQFQMAGNSTTLARVWNGTLSGWPFKDSITVSNVSSKFYLWTIVASGTTTSGNMLIQDNTTKFDGHLNSTYTVSAHGDNQMGLMSRGGGAAHSFHGGGKIAEVLWFDDALSSDDRANVATYLNNKYDLY